VFWIFRSVWSLLDGINEADSGTIWASGCAVVLFTGLWALGHYL
jgi:hypothetical protein